MQPRTLAKTAGIGYVIIFFAAIFANFFVLENLIADPEAYVRDSQFVARLGVVAFLITAVFDVVVAWALYELYKRHAFSSLSTYFRLIHAALMGVGVFALLLALGTTEASTILHHVEVFNTIWLIGLFFFGGHLILLARIIGKPKLIAVFLFIAGVMYMVDTAAHFLLENYQDYATVFLALVAVPSIFGEMALAVWLLVRGGVDAAPSPSVESR